MATIDIGRPMHLSTDEVTEEVRSAAAGGRRISSNAAVTIASWWQSSGPTGIGFAALASTGYVDLDSLLGNITAADREATSPFDREALDALLKWASGVAER